MAKQDLNLGVVADDGTGDKLRTGGQKIKDNFDELYSAVVPAGGTTGQLLAKVDGVDHNMTWVDPPEAGSSLPVGGSLGQILAKASGDDFDVAWVDPPTGGGGEGRPATAQISRSTQQNITGSTDTMVVFDTLEFQDVSGVVNIGANPTRVTVPAGYTLARVSAGIVWSNSSSDYRWARIKKNGTTDVAIDIRPGVNESPQYPRTRWIPVSAGDYFELNVRTNVGGLYVAGAANYAGPTWLCLELSN
jgi:hypothetical protein